MPTNKDAPSFVCLYWNVHDCQDPMAIRHDSDWSKSFRVHRIIEENDVSYRLWCHPTPDWQIAPIIIEVLPFLFFFSKEVHLIQMIIMYMKLHGNEWLTETLRNPPSFFSLSRKHTKSWLTQKDHKRKRIRNHDLPKKKRNHDLPKKNKIVKWVYFLVPCFM